MTSGPQGSEPDLRKAASRGEEESSRPTVNPRLSANLNADYEALQNDMEQAKELAADFQRQLAGKSNEFAQLKQVFEKTQADLASLQAGIMELRAERHHLANESMRSTAFQMKLKKVTEERDRLRTDLEVVRQALAQSSERIAAARHERDSEVAGLIIELVTLKEALAQARSQTPPNGTSPAQTEPERKPGSARIELRDEEIEIQFDS